jgi:hypothetical protein
LIKHEFNVTISFVDSRSGQLRALAYELEFRCSSVDGRVDMRMDVRSVSHVTCCIVLVTLRKYNWIEFIEYVMQYNLTDPEMQYISFVHIISRFQARCSLGNFVGFCCFGWKIGVLSTVMGLFYR